MTVKERERERSSIEYYVIVLIRVAMISLGQLQ